MAPLTDRDSVPVSLTSSGAISVGAYEAGVNWVVTEMLRISEFDAPRAQRIFGPNVRHYFLASAAGASAGNINSVLSAITYCARPDPGALHADSSLFWNIWVNVGIEQLVPGVRYPDSLRDTVDLGLFSRGFFKDHAWEQLRRFRDRAVPYPGCAVPIGFTLTQLDTIHYQVAGPINAPVQRLATVFQVRSDTAAASEYGANHLGFYPLPDITAYRRSLGAIALLPELYVPSPPGAALPARDSAVLWAMEAGSAVPPAFAPRWLCYARPAPWDKAIPPDRATLPVDGHACHRFTDGGVFDNNPLSLGFDLAKHRSEGPSPPPPRRWPKWIFMGFSNPYLLRGAGAVIPPSAGEDSTLGVGYLFDLGRNAIPAARLYELQSLGRFLERETESDGDGVGTAEPKLVPRISSRGTEIVGTQFNSFGAFLGRPFREFDFYTGVYDGLLFVARAFACWNRYEDSGVPTSVAALDQCAQQEHVRLIAQNPFDLDPVSIHMVWQLAANEYGVSIPPGLPALNAGEAARVTVLQAIPAALTQSHPRVGEPSCREAGFSRTVLCSSGFGAFVHALHDSKPVRDALEAARSQRVGCPTAAAAADGGCFVDASVLDLIDKPEDFVANLTEDLLYRAWYIEKHESRIRDRERGANPYPANARVFVTEHRGLLKLGRFAYRHVSGQMWSGFQLDPSSVPDRNVTDTPHALGRALQQRYHFVWYSMSVGAGTAISRGARGQRSIGHVQATPLTIGWQPTIALARRLAESAVTLPLELSYFSAFNPGTEEERHLHAGLAGGVGVTLHKSSFVAPGVAFLYGNHLLKEQNARWGSRSPNPSASDRWGGMTEVSALLGGLGRVAVRYAPDAHSDVHARHELALQVGIVDVNGLLYWLRKK